MPKFSDNISVESTRTNNDANSQLADASIAGLTESGEVDWGSDWIKRHSFVQGIHGDIQLLLHAVADTRTKISHLWVTPNAEDCILFAITEIGEYVDAGLRRVPIFNRNNKKELIDPRLELADTAVMLASAINQLPGEDRSFIWREKVMAKPSVANVLYAIARAEEYLSKSDRELRKVMESDDSAKIQTATAMSGSYAAAARLSLLSALAECFLLCGESSLLDFSILRLERIRSRVEAENEWETTTL